MFVMVACRLAVYFGSMIWPIPNENLVPISPLNGQGYFDFLFYLDSLEQYRTESLGDILEKFITFYQRPFEAQFGHIIAGPIFPAIIGLFNYHPENTLPLSVAFLVLDCLWAGLWIKWAANRKYPTIALIGFAVAPNPIWFMLVLSPDLIFAFLVGVFYLSYFRKSQTRKSTLIWIMTLITVLMTRPNGYSILIFVLLDIFWSNYRSGGYKIWRLAFLTVLSLLFAVYLYPYFITEMRKTAVDHIFFGLRASEYAEGIFPMLPGWIDFVLSWLTLIVVKILNFVGLRPSYGATQEALVFIRAISGVVLLPGLIWGIIRAGTRHRMFLLIFFLPIFLGPSQDRYNLPVFPLLFFFGIAFYQYYWNKLINRDN
jgi:hypothetical protein